MLEENDLKQIKRIVTASVRPLNKKLDLVIRYFDLEVSNHGKRLKRLETHLKLPPMAD